MASKRKSTEITLLLFVRGRAGPQVKLHLDRLDAADPSLFTLTEDPSMTAKVNFDGAEFEVTESVALAVTKEREDAKKSYEDMKKMYDGMMSKASEMKEEMDAMQQEMKGKTDSAEGRADALAEEVESLKLDLEAAKQVNVDSLVEERIALIDKARTSLDSAFDFAGLLLVKSWKLLLRLCVVMLICRSVPMIM
jgi:uncharacterized protein